VNRREGSERNAAVEDLANLSIALEHLIRADDKLGEKEADHLERRILSLLADDNISGLEALLDSSNRSARLVGARIMSECKASLRPITQHILRLLREGDVVLQRVTLSALADSGSIGSTLEKEIITFLASDDLPSRRSAWLWLLFADLSKIETALEDSRDIRQEDLDVLRWLHSLKKGNVGEQAFRSFLENSDPDLLAEFIRVRRVLRAKGVIA